MLLEKNAPKATAGWIKKKVSHKIIDPSNLSNLCLQIKEKGQTIVTLNGCFDLLHIGHLEMLAYGASLGNQLIVLLNTDRSIREYKGENRPIHPLDVRLLQIAAIEGVSFVSWFDEEDPRSILSQINPNIHVNGVGYGKDCIEAPIVKKGGGEIMLCPFVEGHSTTCLVEKINSSCV